MVLVSQPPVARVNGLRVPVGFGWRVSDVAAELGVVHGPGDLIDTRGNLLKAGAGLPAMAWVGNQPLGWDARVPRHQRVVLSPPAHRTETVADQVRLVDAPVTLPAGGLEAGSSSRPWVRGIERRTLGRETGRTASWDIAYASAVVYGPTTGKQPRRVALTFDDGPNPPTTDRILALLKRYDARATFFVLGQGVAPLADCARRVVASGSEIGIHSWHHDWYTRRGSTWLRADIARCQKALSTAGLPPARWLRPPYGAHNARIDAVIRSMGLSVAMWDVDPFDWRRPGAAIIHRRVVSRVHNGDVVLLHDGGGSRSQTIAALEMILKTLSARGYSFVTMSELHGREFPFTGAFRLNVGGAWFTYTPRLPVAGPVRVGGVTLDLDEPALLCRGEILVPVRPACAQLHLTLTYDRPHQTLGIEGPGGLARVPLDHTRIQMNGRPEMLPVPPVLYRNTGYVPVSLLRRLAAAAGVSSPSEPLAPRAAPAVDAPLAAPPAPLPGFAPDQSPSALL